MSARKAGLGFILVTLFLDILGIGLIIPILPKLLESFIGSGPEGAARTYGWFAAVYALMQFVFSPLLGSLSDRFGRRPVLLLSLLGAGLDYLLLAFAPTLTWLFVGRVLAGITGASIGTATAYIADVSPPEKRAQNFGLVGMAFGLGFIAGPAMGGILGNENLRLPFLVAAALSLANALYGLFVLPESLPREQRRAFDLRKANPLGGLRSLGRYPVVFSLMGMLSMFFLAQRGLENVWALYTEHRFHWSPRQVGLSLAVVGLTAAIVQGGLVRRVVPWLGERRAIVVGLVVSAVAMVGYGAASQGWMIFVVLVFGSLGGIAGPACQGLMSKAVPANEQGLLQGAMTSVQSLIHIVAPLIASNLFSTFAGPAAPVYLPGASFFAGAIFIGISVLLALRTFRRHPEALGAPDTTASATEHAA